MDEMPWTGRNGYLAAPVEEWRVDGTLAGEYKTFGDLSVCPVSFWGLLHSDHNE